MMTEYIVSRAKVGCPPSSMSAEIMKTSRLITAKVRIIVP